MRAKKPQIHGKLGRPRTYATAPTIGAASGRLGISRDVLKLAKNMGCPAFLSNGNVRLEEAREFVFKHPELAKDVESLPDIKRVKTLTAIKVLENMEIEQGKLLGKIAELERITMPLIGLGKLTVSRMLCIPDRVAARYAETTDSQVIKLDLEKEIRNALKILSESEMSKIIEEAKQK